MQLASEKVNVLHYRDLVAYLEALYTHIKSRVSPYSIRAFSEDLGCSPSYIHHVMKGRRSIGQASRARIVDAIGLKEKKAQHFLNLIKLSHPTSHKDLHQRSAVETEVMKRGGHPGRKQIEKRHFKFFSHWYIPAIRDLIGLESFRLDYRWIAQALQPKITATEAKQAVKILLELGFVSLNEDGTLSVTDSTLATPDEIRSRYAILYHAEMLTIALQAIDNVPAEKREIGATSLGIDSQTANRIKKKIRDFRLEILDDIRKSGTGTEVYQLCFQFFPLTNITAIEES